MKYEEVFRINNYLSVKLECARTHIYVNDEKFTHCKYLLLNVDLNNIQEYDKFDSIDEISDTLDHRLETRWFGKISPRTEYKAHCSNLQAWAENDYDTRILERRLAFPLLKKLTEAGDNKANNVFKQEVNNRVNTGLRKGYYNVINYLAEEGYLKHTNKETLVKLLNTGNGRVQRNVFENYLMEVNELTRAELSCVDWNNINFKEFKYTNDKIERIPEVVKRFKQLRELDLSYNNLKSINGLEELTKLELLNLRGNNLSNVEELLHLENLKNLNLSENHINFNNNSLKELVNKNSECFIIT